MGGSYSASGSPTALTLGVSIGRTPQAGPLGSGTVCRGWAGGAKPPAHLSAPDSLPSGRRNYVFLRVNEKTFSHGPFLNVLSNAGPSWTWYVTAL